MLVPLVACATCHAASIHLNKVMKFTMCSVDHAICVSNTCRENLVLRATLSPEKISAIPNAIDPSKFTPNPSARYPKGTINVVIMSRLVYRKGVDLVAPVIKVGSRITRQICVSSDICGGGGRVHASLESVSSLCFNIPCFAARGGQIEYEPE